MSVYYLLNLWIPCIRINKEKKKTFSWRNGKVQHERISQNYCWDLRCPSLATLACQLLLSPGEDGGVWKRRLLFVPAPASCFLFLLHTIMDHESWPAAWVSFLSATVVSICWVSCLFSTKLLYLGSNLPVSDKVQEKPILIELFSECYANMSKLRGSQFCSKIWFGLHVNSSRGEKERKKNPKCWDTIFHSLEYFLSLLLSHSSLGPPHGIHWGRASHSVLQEKKGWNKLKAQCYV